MPLVQSEFLKANSIHIYGFPEEPEIFLEKSAKTFNPSGYQKSVNIYGCYVVAFGHFFMTALAAF
jgi:hypothetical protein